MKSCDNCPHTYVCEAKRVVLDAISSSFFRESYSGRAINVYKGIKEVLGEYCRYWEAKSLTKENEENTNSK